MSKGEDQKVSGGEGSQVESEAGGTQEGKPEDEASTELAQLVEKAVAVATAPLVERMTKAEQHGKAAQGAYDYAQELMKKQGEHFEGFLGRVKLAEGEDAEAVTKDYRSERGALDLEAELAGYKAREEGDKATTEIRQQAEQVVQRMNKRFGVEIPMDKVPDPVEKQMSPDVFAGEVAAIALEMIQAKDTPGGEELPTGAQASLMVGPGAATRTNPIADIKDPTELLKMGYKGQGKKRRGSK